MAKEIERRFLPAAGFDPAPLAHGSKDIRQSYLPIGGDMVMRLRQTTTDHGVSHDLTFKARDTAMTNDEHPLDIEQGLYDRLRLQAGPEIVKRRHLVGHAGREWEVDVFEAGDPDIPLVAEIELESEDAALDVPDWAGREVTGDRHYSNDAIAGRMAAAGA